MIRRDYDGINTLLVKEKKAGCSNWRTKTAYTLKPTAIHQIISEREYTYSHCSTMTGWADRWYHYDLLGSVTALTGGDGQVIALYEQDAYGNVLSGTTPGLNRHLTGKELDPDTGLYYFGARWYDPRTAQWIEPEPFGFDGPNLYWFLRGHPPNSFDPYGLYDYGRFGAGCINGSPNVTIEVWDMDEIDGPPVRPLPPGGKTPKDVDVDAYRWPGQPWEFLPPTGWHTITGPGQGGAKGPVPKQWTPQNVQEDKRKKREEERQKMCPAVPPYAPPWPVFGI